MMNDLQFIKNAENTLLASFLSDSSLFDETNFKEEYFYFNDNKEIFKAMKSLIKKELPLDEDFILKELKNPDDYKNKLIEIITVLPKSSTEQIENVLIENYEKRQLKQYLLRKINDLEEEQALKVLSEIQEVKLQGGGYKFPIKNTKFIKAEVPNFYIKDICPIQIKEINLFTSKGGGGKSFSLLLLLAKLQERGLKCFGWFSEDSTGGTTNRLQILKNTNKDLKDIHIDILGKDFRLQNFIKIDKNGNYEISDFFFEFVKNMRNYDVILLDPLVSLICKDENSNIEARFLFNLLNAWIEKENKTLLLIHHDGKGDKNSSSRGASAIIDAVRMHYSLETVQNMTTHRKFVLKKANHFFGDKKEFIIQLFKNEIKPTEVIYKDDDKKEEYNEEEFNKLLGLLD